MNTNLNLSALPVSIVTLMGVSGCGKTTIGISLAERLGWKFIESDDFHSTEDIRKMSAGIPPTDADRAPWLKRLNRRLREEQAKGFKIILACSALRQSYRQLLCNGTVGCVFVYLKGDFALIQERMLTREHFMKASMLQSQFDALEEPENALIVDIRMAPKEIINQIVYTYSLET